MFVLYHTPTGYIKIRGTENPRFTYKFRKDWKSNYTLTNLDIPDYEYTLDCLLKVENGKIINVGKIDELESMGLPNVFNIFPPIFEDER